METIETIIIWHKETFPDTTLEQQMAKFEEELREFKRDSELSELSDMFIACCGLARFDIGAFLACFGVVQANVWDDGLNMSTLAHNVSLKMKINRKRKWAKVDGIYRHVEEK